MTRPARQRALVFALWLLALAAAAWQIAHTRFTADLSAFLPRSPDAQQRMLIEQLESGAPSRTLLLAIEGGSAATRAEASRALAAAMRTGGRFEQVSNGERAAFAALGSWLFEHRYLLSPAVGPERFGAAGLREAIDEALSLLGTPAGVAVKPLLERDPSGETTRIGETLIPASAPRSENGVWVARDGSRALLLALTRAAGGDLDAHERTIAELRDAFAAWTAAAGAPGLTLHISGAPKFAVDSRASIEREVRFLAIAGTLLMSVLLLAAFASPLALAVALLPVGTGVLAGIAAVSLGFGTVHGITLGFGATLIGESVDYAIYYLIQARAGAAAAPGAAGMAAGPGAGTGWRHWLVHGWPTVRLGLLTSVCGFGALVFSGFPGLAQLGVFSIAGLVAAALATRFVLPPLQPDGASGRGLRGFLGRAAAALVHGAPRLRGPVVLLALAALALLVLRGAPWRADLAALSPIEPAAIALDQRLRADLGTSDARMLVVVEGPDAETTLQRAEAAAARLDDALARGALPGLAGFDTVTRFLPSLATQRMRQASLPEAAPLRAALDAATRGGPLGAARLEPFVDEVQRARAAPLLTPQSVRGGPAAPLVDALFAPRAGGGHLALLPLHAVGEGIDAGALAAALAGLPGTQALDLKRGLDALYARYLGEAQWQALIGALAVVALMALALRSPRRLLAVCEPLALAVLLTMGGLMAAGVTLGILHLVGLLLVVAVGSNYALFFDALRAEADAPPDMPPGTRPDAAPGPTPAPASDTLASLLLANLTTVAAFGLLAVSAIPALSAIGRVVAPGALLALVLAAAFARAPRPGATAARP